MAMLVAKTRLEELQLRKLLDCIRNKDAAVFNKLVINGLPNLVNYIENSPEGIGAVHLCALANDTTQLQALLEAGASPNLQDALGRTPAMIAAEFGHLSVMKLLDSDARKPNMKLKDAQGRGVLFRCLSNTKRHLACCDIAIRRGADCNNTDYEGIPVLYEACVRATELEDICLKLLEFGANPNKTTLVRKESALHAAAQNGSSQVCKALIAAGAKTEMTDRKKLTSAHMAARLGHLHILQLLAAHGAPLGEIDLLGNTPMHYAAMGGHAMCVKFLAYRMCAGSVKNKQGMLASKVALLLKKEQSSKAIKKEFTKCSKFAKKASKLENSHKINISELRLYDWVQEYEADIMEHFRAADQSGSGFVEEHSFYDILELHGPKFATPEQFRKIYKLHDRENSGLIKYGDFIGGKKYIHKTYLRTQFCKKARKKRSAKGRKGKRKKFKLAMPICTRDEGPRMPNGAPPANYIQQLVPIFDWSKFNRDNQPVHPIFDDSYWYMKNGGTSYINMNTATRQNDVESLRKAIESGRVNVDQRDKYYKTPLMAACRQGNIEMSRLLVSLGADVNARDNFFWTPLHFACNSGQLPIVQMLMDAGANPNAVTMHKATPLMRAVETSRIEIVEYLLEKGVSLTPENAKEETALDKAYKWADPRVTNKLQTKFDQTVPPMTEADKLKKKKEEQRRKSKASSARSRKSVVSSGKSKPFLPPITPQGPDREYSMDPESVFDGLGKKSVVLLASSLATGTKYDKEDLTYRPPRWWVNMPSQQDLIKEKQRLRGQHTWEYDFPNSYKMPFPKHIEAKAAQNANI